MHKETIMIRYTNEGMPIFDNDFWEDVDRGVGDEYWPNWDAVAESQVVEKESPNFIVAAFTSLANWLVGKGDDGKRKYYIRSGTGTTATLGVRG